MLYIELSPVNQMRLTHRFTKALFFSFIVFHFIVTFHGCNAATPELLLDEIIFEGNETRTYSDVILNITGKIKLSDESELILEQVKVVHVNVISVHGNATLVLKDADIRQIINTYNSGSLSASGSRFFFSNYCPVHKENHTYGGVRGKDNSTIVLDTCKIGRLWLENNSRVEVVNSNIFWVFNNGANMTVKDSVIHRHREFLRNVESSLVLPDFKDYSGSLGDIFPGSRNHFENSSLGLYLHLDNSNITINDSRLLTVYGEENTDLQLTNVTLSYLNGNWSDSMVFVTDCYIDEFCIHGSNIQASVTGSKIGRFCFVSPKLDLEIRDTEIEDFTVNDAWYNSFNASIIDSTIGIFYPGLGQGEAYEYNLDNVTVFEVLGFRNNIHSMKGGLWLHGDIHFGENILLNASDINGFIIIKRNYTIQCTRNGKPVKNVHLIAQEGNHTYWEGDSNQDGTACITLKFVKDVFHITRQNNSSPKYWKETNLTKIIFIQWTSGNNEGSIEFGLTSNTPVLIEITRKTDYFRYLIPVILILLVILVIGKRKIKSRKYIDSFLSYI